MKANLLMVAVAYNKNLLYVEIIKPRDAGLAIIGKGRD
jgi:hypothetical protein